MSPVAIKGGSLDVLMEGDRIVAIGAFDLPPGTEIIDASGLHVAPGLVDLGVFAVERRAFAAGGITRIGLMPDLSPPLDDPASSSVLHSPPSHICGFIRLLPLRAASQGSSSPNMR